MGEPNDLGLEESKDSRSELDQIKTEIAELRTETDSFKQVINQKDQELAWYRGRIARLEEQLRGAVDPELDQKKMNQILDDQSQFDQNEKQHQEKEECKSAAAETPQPAIKKKRKKRAKKPKYEDCSSESIDEEMVARIDLSRLVQSES